MRVYSTKDMILSALSLTTMICDHYPATKLGNIKGTSWEYQGNIMRNGDGMGHHQQ